MLSLGGGNYPQNLYDGLCSMENLELAFKKARKGKTLKPYVIEFEENLESNLTQLQVELMLLCYKPRPLKTFILRDPKTRKISKSDFRDRVIHHAICNIIEPFFEKMFIFDSYANRKQKGAFKAIDRFEYFVRKSSRGFTRPCYVLKADIRHYFDTVDHKVLLSILQRTIRDPKLLRLIQTVLVNHKTKESGKGMPLGNLTSQFFANVYLNELDHYVKHILKAKYYIRYVDDFVVLHHQRTVLEQLKKKIDTFCENTLALQLHPDKSRILQLQNGVDFLGFRLYSHHKRIKKKNVKRFERKFLRFREEYHVGKITREKVVESFEGWLAHTAHADTFKYRKHLTRQFNTFFPLNLPVPFHHSKKHENLLLKSERSSLQFSVQKTLRLFTQGKSVQEITRIREVKENTVWNHLANLIEYNQISFWKVIEKEKAKLILQKIFSENDSLKQIKTRLTDKAITYNEIQCTFAYVKSKNRVKNINHHLKWYKKVHCVRKCFFDRNQRKLCESKFDHFQSYNPDLSIKRQDFVDLFNDHLNICILPEKEKKKYLSWEKFRMIKNYVINKKKKEDVTPPTSTKP